MAKIALFITCNLTLCSLLYSFPMERANEGLCSKTYDRLVHQHIAFEAQYVLNNALMEIHDHLNASIEHWRNYQDQGYQGGDIITGAAEEDVDSTTDYYCDYLFLHKAYCGHFWEPDNPQHGDYDEGLKELIANNYNSSFTIARRYWVNEVLANYHINKDRSYYYLGRVAHLLSDACVPAHVHLDPHDCSIVFTPDSLEAYAGEHYTDDVYLGSNFVGQNYDYKSLISGFDWSRVDPTTKHDDYFFQLFWYVAQKTQYFASNDWDALNDDAWVETWVNNYYATLDGRLFYFGDKTNTLLWDNDNSIKELVTDKSLVPSRVSKIAEACIPHAMKSVAALYKLFWDSVDRDNDGFSVIQGDCDDDDPSKNPGIPGSCDTNQLPQLSGAVVTPISGNISTTFDFSIHYLDPDGNGAPPLIAEVKIDGIAHDLAFKAGSGSKDNGIYSYSTSLPRGVHSYSFFFRDSNFGAAGTTIYSGPVVGALAGEIPVQFYFGGGGAVPVNDCFELCYSVNGGPEKCIAGSQLIAPGVIDLISVPSTLTLRAKTSISNIQFSEWEVKCGTSCIYCGIEETKTIPIENCTELSVASFWTYSADPMFTLEGIVSSEGGPIADALVTLSGQVNGSYQTQSNGRYSFSNLPGGASYLITCAHPEFAFVPTNYNLTPCLKASSDSLNFNGVSADSEPPSVRITSGPGQYYDSSNMITFHWVGADSKTPADQIKFQYRVLGSLNESWSNWTTDTTLSLNLSNGVYTLELKAIDQAGNETVSPLRYVFAVSASPKIIEPDSITGRIWWGSFKVTVPAGTSGGSKIVVRPEEFGLSGIDFVPLRLFALSGNAIGTLDFARQELGIPGIFIKAEVGFVLSLPKVFIPGDQETYLIQWGKLIHLGWEDQIKLPEIPNLGAPSANYSYYIGGYVDDSDQIWRSWAKNQFMIPGIGVTRNAAMYKEVFNSTGNPIEHLAIDFNPAEYSFDSVKGSYVGSSWQFTSMGNSFLERQTEVWAFWRVNEYHYEAPGYKDVNYNGYAFQKFDKRSHGPIGVPVYSSRASGNSFSNPVLASDGLVYVLGETPNGLIYSKVSPEGIIIETNPIVNINQDQLFDESHGPIPGIDGRMWYFYIIEWQANDRTRSEIYFKIFNPDSSVYLEQQRIGPAASDPAINISEQKFFNYDPLIASDGKVWVAYATNTTGTLEYYYLVFNSNGTLFKNPVKENRAFRFEDLDGLIWTTITDGFEFISADDHLVGSPHHGNVIIPNQKVGKIAALIDGSSYQLFDRWSSRRIEILVEQGTPSGTLQIYDVDEFNQGAKTENLHISAPAVSLLEVPGLLTQGTNVDLQNSIQGGVNYLSFAQDGLLGGELIVGFTPKPVTFKRADSNLDGDIDISDPIHTLICLFLNGNCKCEDAADADDNGIVELTDVIFTLNFIFLAGQSPPIPYPGCGTDTPGDSLGCDEASAPCK